MGLGGWRCFLDGRVGCLQQRSVLPSINTQVVQPTFPESMTICVAIWARSTHPMPRLATLSSSININVSQWLLSVRSHAIWFYSRASSSICSTNQLLVLRGWPGVLLSSIRLVSRGWSSCVPEVWMLQVARSGENEEQANTNSPPPLSTPSTSSSGISGGGASLGRAPRGEAGWQRGMGDWRCFLDGRVGRLQQRSLLPSIN